MKAIIWTAYGPPEVLELRDVKKPEPAEGEVLIRVRATTVTAGDCEMRSLQFPALLRLAMRLWVGLLRPREMTIPGTEFAGEVEAVGEGATLFKAGDRVFGSAGMHLGAYAEYICLPERGSIAPLPTSMSFEDAAAVPFGGRDALHFLRKGHLERGQRILIIGAGGSIGTFAVQLAKYFGAKVTAVDRTEKLNMLRELGADHVVDYTTGGEACGDGSYDVIFDVVGRTGQLRCLQDLEEHGVYLLANPGLFQSLRGVWTSLISSRRVVAQTAEGTKEELLFLKELAEAGVLHSVIDRRYPLEQIQEAHRYVETGRKKGNLIISVA